MQKAYRNLVKYALDNGYTVSVFDGEEWSTVRSTRFNDIIKDIEGVEEAALNIRDEGGHRVGWALVSAFGLAPDETVVDYTTTPFMKGWEAQYYPLTLLCEVTA
jgi:hypothetical protein